MKTLLLALVLCALPAFGQVTAICFDTTLSATGRAVLLAPGTARGDGAPFVSGQFTYRTTGTPAGVSISIEAGNVAAATQAPFEQIAAVTSTTGANMGHVNGSFRYWYANVATLSGGSSPTIVLTSCFARTGLASADGAGGVSTFTQTTVPFSATPTFAADLANIFVLTLTADVTSSTLSGALEGEPLIWLICQDGTGNWTFAWPGNVLGGMTVGPTAATCSSQSFFFDGTNAYATASGVSGM